MKKVMTLMLGLSLVLAGTWRLRAMARTPHVSRLRAEHTSQSRVSAMRGRSLFEDWLRHTRAEVVSVWQVREAEGI